MPSKDKITESMYTMCVQMFKRLLSDSDVLGVGYVLQLVYELAVVIVSYEAGCSTVSDGVFRDKFEYSKAVFVTRNSVNHNSYDIKKINNVVNNMLSERVIEKLYLFVIGEAPDYDLFETECYVYLENMKRLWRKEAI